MARSGSLGIRSKLILILLGVGMLATVVIAALGYVSGRADLRDRVYAQLISLRNSKANEVQLYLDVLQGHVESLSEDLMVVEAVGAFSDAYTALDGAALSETEVEQLRTFYEDEFFGRIQLDDETAPVLSEFMPQAPTARALQLRYLVAAPNPLGEKGAYEGPETSDVAYDAVHRRYHNAFRTIVEEFDYYDLFLVDPDGRIVYSVEKEIDFGTSLRTGPYRDSQLAEVVTAVRRARGTGTVEITDFETYWPSFGQPAAFMAAPLYDEGAFVGTVAVQFPIDQINAIMTEDGEWAESGLGEQGEIFLVGHDTLLRSVARPFVEDPEGYLNELREAGIGARTLRAIERTGTPILQQRATSEAVMRAIAGQEGVMEIPRDYLGRRALSAYTPLQLDGLDWVIVTEMPTAEAYASLARFGRRVVLSAAVLSLLITLVAMALARVFIQPMRRLIAGIERARDGKTDTVTAGSGDELEDVATAFTGLLRELKARTDYVEEQRGAVERLMGRFLPPVLTREIDGGDLGEERVLHEIPNVAVCYVHLIGHDTLVRAPDPERVVVTLDRVLQSTDALAMRYDLERVRFCNGGYVAACGLAEPRLDYARRAVDFALEFRSVIRHLASELGIDLAVQIGVASGDVVAGVIGKERLAFDVWGAPVLDAQLLSRVAPPDGILVTTTVQQRLADLYTYDEAPADLSVSSVAVMSRSNTVAATQ